MTTLALPTEAGLAGIIASAMDAIITVDAQQRIVLFNPAAERTFGVPAAMAIGTTLDRFIPSRYRDAHGQHVHRFGATGIAHRQMGSVSRVQALRADGSEFPIEASISHATVDGRKLFTVVLRDVTEREQAEARIREQAELLDKVTNAILVVDEHDCITFWNRGAERLYGWATAEAMGRSPVDLLQLDHLHDSEQAAAVLAATGTWSGELRQRTRDGRPIVVESHWTRLRTPDGTPRGTIIVNIDVTEKKELESRFLRAQRLESVGTLVSGIAHDLNNMLTPILMAVRLLKSDKPGLDRRALLDTAHASVERGAAMIRQLLAFAGGAEGERATLSLAPILHDVCDILRHSLPKSIRLQLEVSDTLKTITGDATQLSQVLMNLGVNARDAMPDGGTLLVNAENIVLTENIANHYPDARPGSYVVLRVTDTGTGIPADVQERIFDPFFTTKPFGQGTGLGLSTVRGIVKAHGGFVHVTSAPNRGSTFAVYLPTHAESAAAVSTADAPIAVGQGECILIVDDEPFILMTTQTALESNGYRVLTADGGATAVEIFGQSHAAIDYVLLDMMMPRIDGPATIRELKRIDPAVKIIATSGVRPAEGLAAEVAAFLKKPYSDSDLLRILAGLTPARR